MSHPSQLLRVADTLLKVTGHDAPLVELRSWTAPALSLEVHVSRLVHGREQSWLQLQARIWPELPLAGAVARAHGLREAREVEGFSTALAPETCAPTPLFLAAVVWSFTHPKRLADEREQARTWASMG
eukprot:13815982-Alexandrium_andersonii.AAC.1